MAILPNAANCLKVTLVGQNQGTPWMNNLFFQAAGAIPQDATQFSTFATSIATAWGAQIAPLCNEQVSLLYIIVTDLTDRDRMTFTATLPTPPVGTLAGDVLPVQVAMAFSWIVRLRYRGGHGRIYVPAGVQASIAGGRLWDPTFRATAATAANNFRTTIEGLSVGTVQVNFVVLSYFSGSHKTPADPHPDPVLRATPLPIPVVQAAVRTRVDTQRRRLGKETI